MASPTLLASKALKLLMAGHLFGASMAQGSALPPEPGTYSERQLLSRFDGHFRFRMAEIIGEPDSHKKNEHLHFVFDELLIESEGLSRIFTDRLSGHLLREKLENWFIAQHFQMLRELFLLLAKVGLTPGEVYRFGNAVASMYSYGDLKTVQRSVEEGHREIEEALRNHFSNPRELKKVMDLMMENDLEKQPAVDFAFALISEPAFLKYSPLDIRQSGLSRAWAHVVYEDSVEQEAYLKTVLENTQAYMSEYFGPQKLRRTERLPPRDFAETVLAVLEPFSLEETMPPQLRFEAMSAIENAHTKAPRRALRRAFGEAYGEISSLLNERCRTIIDQLDEELN